MKKTIADSLFVASQAFLLASKDYAGVIANCEKRTMKSGVNYGTLYVLIHAYYYQGSYNDSFDSFCELFRGFSIGKKLKQWAISSFLISPYFYNKNYSEIARRGKLLVGLNFSKEEKRVVAKYIIFSLYNQNQIDETKVAFSDFKSLDLIEPEVERIIPKEALY